MNYSNGIDEEGVWWANRPVVVQINDRIERYTLAARQEYKRLTTLGCDIVEVTTMPDGHQEISGRAIRPDDV